AEETFAADDRPRPEPRESEDGEGELPQEDRSEVAEAQLERGPGRRKRASPVADVLPEEEVVEEPRGGLRVPPVEVGVRPGSDREVEDREQPEEEAESAREKRARLGERAGPLGDDVEGEDREEAAREGMEAEGEPGGRGREAEPARRGVLLPPAQSEEGRQHGERREAVDLGDHALRPDRVGEPKEPPGRERRGGRTPRARGEEGGDGAGSRREEPARDVPPPREVAEGDRRGDGARGEAPDGVAGRMGDSELVGGGQQLAAVLPREARGDRRPVRDERRKRG